LYQSRAVIDRLAMSAWKFIGALVWSFKPLFPLPALVPLSLCVFHARGNYGNFISKRRLRGEFPVSWQYNLCYGRDLRVTWIQCLTADVTSRAILPICIAG
jgi:hypothetical protein